MLLSLILMKPHANEIWHGRSHRVWRAQAAFLFLFFFFCSFLPTLLLVCVRIHECACGVSMPALGAAMAADTVTLPSLRLPSFAGSTDGETAAPVGSSTVAVTVSRLRSRRHSSHSRIASLPHRCSAARSLSRPPSTHRIAAPIGVHGPNRHTVAASTHNHPDNSRMLTRNLLPSLCAARVADCRTARWTGNHWRSWCSRSCSNSSSCSRQKLRCESSQACERAGKRNSGRDGHGACARH